MKKLFIIIILAVIQCACASSPGSLPGSTSLLSFDAIGAEITVGYENLEAPDEPLAVVAMNLD